MKNYIQYLTIGALLMGSLTSCNDFLDREPLDKVTPEKFFSAEADLAAYAINNYKFVTVDDKYGINLFGKDNDTDNQASGTSNSFWIPGEKKVAADRGEWKWEDIRSCNYFFDQVLPRYEEGAITGNQDNVKHYIGEMYVNRAYSYFQLFTKFGDLPIVTTALPDIQGELVEASKRQPRHKVARFIIEDLKKAEDMLLNNPPGGKNRISKNVAYLLHARVALYEATWEKYHRGTAFVPGGSGWPGKDAQGYDADVEINYFLDEAIAASKFVADQMVGNLAENTDTPEGMNASLVSINPYYTMFCDENMEGYKEILMWKKFDESLGVTSNLQMELCRNGGGSGWTRGMVNSFLMRNGLPVYASGSGYNPDWEKEGVVATVQNRDWKQTSDMKEQLPKHYFVADEIRKHPDKDDKTIVIVIDPTTKSADVILPAGASPEVDNEIPGLNKARIGRALRREGVKTVRFFNPDGALGYRPDDRYFAEKQVSLARLKNWSLEVLSTLNVTPAVKRANEIGFDKIQMIQDDKNRWALYIKPEHQKGYSIYPDKEDVNRFFSTLKQAMDNIDKVRMELAHKYYALAEIKPDLKVDLFNSGTQDIDLNRIQRVSVFKTKQDGVLCVATIDGQKLQPRSVTPQQWQRMWVAEDRDSYKRHLAATLFADVLQKGQSQEEHAGESQGEADSRQQDNNQQSRQTELRELSIKDIPEELYGTKWFNKIPLLGTYPIVNKQF